jgi:hypothetical protein
MQKHIHIIYFVLVISIISSLVIYTTSTGILLGVNPVFGEEKEVKFAKKKDKSNSEIDNNNCKSEKVLKGASNKKDLKILSECTKATGKVKHVQEMPDGDYKFLLKLDKEYKSLLNKDNKKKTDGNLVVEVVPRDQDSKYVDLPDKGDRVEVWGAWVEDKPKGWNEIHPAWKVIIN